MHTKAFVTSVTSLFLIQCSNPPVLAGMLVIYRRFCFQEWPLLLLVVMVAAVVVEVILMANNSPEGKSSLLPHPGGGYFIEGTTINLVEEKLSGSAKC